MKKVILIGTSHRFQKFGETGADAFEKFVRQLAADHQVTAIAEEMSPGALRNSNGDPVRSVCLSVAADLNLHHRFCDPEDEERKAAGIRSENDIRIAAWQATGKTDGRLARREIRAAFNKRERIWLKRARKLDEWPLLFVCGANHVESFRKKLAGADIAVEVAAEDCDQPATAQTSNM